MVTANGTVASKPQLAVSSYCEKKRSQGVCIERSDKKVDQVSEVLW